MFSMMITAIAQQTAGNIRGVVKDQTGAVIPGAKVTLKDKKTNSDQTTTATNDGEFQFSNVLVGDYDVTVEAQGFKTLTLSAVRVQLNQTTDLRPTVEAGIQGETIEISAAGQELVQTTTVNLGTTFSSKQNIEMPQATLTANDTGVYNLALLSANVSSSGGTGLGTGGSVGGQRPRQNNFMVDGVDNNDKSVSGPSVYITPEAISEFSLLTNQYSAEFARSTGGQFMAVQKTGSNNFHGNLYGYAQNKHLNALDTFLKNSGTTRETNPRYDFGRYGGNIGGPFPIPMFGNDDQAFKIAKDKLFFFTNFERQTEGSSASPPGIQVPTLEGIAKLNSLSSAFTPANFALFKQYLQPLATSAAFSGDMICAGEPGTIGGVKCLPENDLENLRTAYRIPIGLVNFSAPAWENRYNYVLNIDYNQSERMQHRGRLTYNREAAIDNAAVLPVFYIEAPLRGWIFSYTNLYNISPQINNEFRVAYRRSSSDIPVPNIPFPIGNYDTFPNIGLTDLSMDIGPNSSAPQGGIENNYQLVNNVSWLKGDHSFKFGGDIRKMIAPTVFVQRQRGEYVYSSSDRFLRDISPNELGERNVGASKYYGDQILSFLYAQDEWRFRPNLTLNLGLNYVWQQVPYTARQQTINSISSVPGVLEFNEPKSQKTNFGPRIGVAYSPDFKDGIANKIFGGAGQSSIRAGFSLAYDVIVDNLYLLSNMPQNQITKSTNVDSDSPGFFANGALNNSVPVIAADPAASRANTTSWIPDQEVPYSVVWNLSFQRQLHQNWGVELRYLGTRGVHLPAQTRFNVRSLVSKDRHLPTFLSTPTSAELSSLNLTLADLSPTPGSFIVPFYGNAGFTSAITAFLPIGNSTYHAFSTQVNRRLSRGLQATAAYTFSHLIDDSTAEVFSTVLTPRRAQDFQNMRDERSISGLDRRQRFVLSALYDLPFFLNSGGWKRALLGGFSISGTYTYETGEPATARSAVDSNLNNDSAGDRTILNLAGNKNLAATVRPIKADGTAPIVDEAAGIDESRQTAAYVVNPRSDNQTAYYIQTGVGALANAGRSTMQIPAINNFDISVFKNFGFTETTKFQIRADFLNFFNHPQYTAGSVNSVGLTNTAGATSYNGVNNSLFGRADQTFTSHARVIQVGARLIF